MDVEKDKQDKPYDETLESARIFEDITSSTGRPPAQSKQGPYASERQTTPPGSAPPDRGRPASQPVAFDRPSSSENQQPKQQSIGELFSKLVKTSPPEKIRIEEDSIGSLFKKYIKRG